MVKTGNGPSGLGVDDVLLTAVVEGRPAASAVIHVLAASSDLVREEVAAFPGAVLFRPEGVVRRR